MKFIHDYCGFSYVPGVSVSSLEDKSIQRIHEQLGVIKLSPYKSKIDIIREYGLPVLSKETAAKIELLAHPTDKNKTVRHAIITSEELFNKGLCLAISTIMTEDDVKMICDVIKGNLDG